MHDPARPRRRPRRQLDSGRQRAAEPDERAGGGADAGVLLLIHGDDDRNVQFHQTVDLKRRLLDNNVSVEELVIPDDIHDFLLFRSWKAVTAATGEFFERQFKRTGGSPP
jgi:hypothetical protein